ncbi:MAG: hypothetical protein WC735_04155 [Candidatus Paceibacterota bacterium]|jgi:hypothetical protein
MLSMNKDMNKNLKDSEGKLSASYSPRLRSGEAGEEGNYSMSVMSYTKTQKLITALYMVTDVMDNEEPIRNKLRTLGTEIVSDSSTTLGANMSIRRIEQIMSFLDIASAMNFISEMNCAVLKKEFFGLKMSLQESMQVKPVWLEEFLNSPLEEYSDMGSEGGGKNLSTPAFGHPSRGESKHKGYSNGHQTSTRIGVQKGSTLMQALGEIKMSDRSPFDMKNDFYVLKKQRRDEIINTVKTNPNGTTITDIKTRATGVLVSCSEKTLQRELVSMTKDGVLNKTGEKRWTRYFVK